MPRTHTTPQLRTTTQAARHFLDALDHKYPQWLTHVANELALCDGWAARGEHVGGRGSDISDPVATAAGAREQLEADRVYIGGTIDAVVANLRDILDAIDHTLGVRAPGLPTEVATLRCDGRIDPTCTNVPSDHHDATGTTITGMCDDCWMKACPRCHARPTAQYRQTCDACRMKLAREHAPAA